MKDAECGLLSRHCLISAIPPMCRIHSNPHAIFFMVQESLNFGLICLSGQGTKIIPACCKIVSSMKRIVVYELVKFSISEALPRMSEANAAWS
ncbi:MAG: hypothetical protein AB1Z38_06920, partial [Desulfotignum sp.]